MKRFLIVILFILSIFLIYAGGGSDYEILREENAKLKAQLQELMKEVQALKQSQPKTIVKEVVKPAVDVEKINALKQENEQLKSQLMQIQDEMKAMKEVVSDLAKQQKQINQKLPTFKDLFQSKYKVKFYGYIKFDAIWNSSKVAALDGASFWALPKNSTNAHDDEFSMTARQSRLGFIVQGPKDDVIKKMARLEMDFYGANDRPERGDRAHLRMRHAYLKLDFPNDWSLLAGQTWDVVSPLAPHILDFGVRASCGDMAYRSPQIRLTKIFRLKKEKQVKVELALSDPKDAFDRWDWVNVPSGSLGHAQDSGLPFAQARVSVKFNNWTDKPMELGLSGFYGKTEYDVFINNDKSHERVDAWAGNVDYQIPLTEKLKLIGEAHYGSNLGTMYGGIGETVVIANPFGGRSMDVYPIRSYGAWTQLLAKINKKWSASIGYGFTKNDDDVFKKDTLGVNYRKYNRAIFGNVFYNITKDVMAGFELTHYLTSYSNGDNGKALRAMFSLIYKF